MRIALTVAATVAATVALGTQAIVAHAHALGDGPMFLGYLGIAVPVALCALCGFAGFALRDATV